MVSALGVSVELQTAADLLAFLNFLIALGYFVVVYKIVSAPLWYRWTRYLGVLWFLLATYTGIFFLGCGAHHLDMAYHLFDDPTFIDPDDYWHFVVVDVIQPIGALSALWLIRYRGGRMLDRLLEVLVRFKPDVIQRLADRLEGDSG